MPEYFEMMKSGRLRNEKEIRQSIWDLMMGMLAYNVNQRFDHKTAQ